MNETKPAILSNISRKSSFVDNVEYYDDGYPMPSWIDINVTDLCNRRCTFCPRVDDSIYPNQNLHMSIDLITKIAKELHRVNYSGGLVFCGFSEPLLHPNIIEMVHACGDLKTEIVTNGDPLTPEIIVGLFESGLNYLLVSLYDGPHQVEYFTKMFEEAGIEKNRYTLRDRWYDESQQFGLMLTNRAGVIATDQSSASIATDRPCFYTHYSMMVDWNGDVLVCVQDWNKKVKFGNLSVQSLHECWTSNPMMKFRNRLGNGRRDKSPCINCDVNGQVHGFNHAKAWKNVGSSKNV